MFARHPSAKKKLPRKKAAVARPCPVPQSAAASEAVAAEDLDLLAAYQRQICELELTVTGLRERVEELSTADAELSESSAHFRELFENAPTGYLVHDRVGTILELNRAGAALLGLRPRDGARACLARFVPREELELWLDHMHRCAVHGRATAELSFERKDGRMTPVQMVTVAVPRPLAQPPTRFRTTLIDVTQHRENDERNLI